MAIANGFLFVFSGLSNQEKHLVNPELLKLLSEDIADLLAMSDAKAAIQYELEDNIKPFTGQLPKNCYFKKSIQLGYSESLYMTYFDIVDPITIDSLPWLAAVCKTIEERKQVYLATVVSIS